MFNFFRFKIEAFCLLEAGIAKKLKV